MKLVTILGGPHDGAVYRVEQQTTFLRFPRSSSTPMAYFAKEGEVSPGSELHTEVIELPIQRLRSGKCIAVWRES